MPQTLPRVAAVLLACSMVAVASAQKPTDKAKPLAIKDIMLATHTKTGPLNKVGQAVKGGRWDEAAPLAVALVKAGDDLAKAKAPAKGSAASWAKLVEQYQTDTKAIVAAIANKDVKDFKDALDTLNSSCRTCHTTHK